MWGLLALFGGLAATGISETAYNLQKEIPAEYYNNKALMYEDKVIKCLPYKEIQRNIKKGKYYAPKRIPIGGLDDDEDYEKYNNNNI